MTRDEIKATSGILVIAGSETTATLLSGATFLLLKNPSSLAKAVNEVRKSFVHASDITFASVTAQLPYLNACLEESLRLYPPVPTVLPRRTARDGDIINGHFVPPDVSKVQSTKNNADKYRPRPPLASTPGALTCPLPTSNTHKSSPPSVGLATNVTPMTTAQHVSLSPWGRASV